MPNKKIRLLFVDDDPVTCSVIKRNFDKTDYEVLVFESALLCLREFKSAGAELVVTDLRMPEMGGFELLSELRSIDKKVPILVMTGYSSVENAVEAMKKGATDFIKKPFDFEELKIIIDRNLESYRLKKENQQLKKRIRSEGNKFGMVGTTEVMESLYNDIEKLADINCNVIVSGESGTGKELVARALHDTSANRDGPFVIIDCGALSESLLESELFGYEKGAFTGAHQRKHGLMEQANGGTLFLDEISNISDAMQMKLMRAIESRTITPVGATQAISVNVRVIVASNRDLPEMVAAKQFRHDFYHRLNVVTIKTPSLVERKEDIPLLIDAFVAHFARQYRRNVDGFEPGSLQELVNAEWPGNIRQLRNVVERSVILAEEQNLTWDRPEKMDDGSRDNIRVIYPQEQLPTLDKLEETYIEHVLRQTEGKKTMAAKILGIDKTTLWRKLRKYEEQ